MKNSFRIYLSRIVLVLYVISVCLLCFLNLGTGVDMGAEWFGIPKDKIAHFLMFFPYPALVTLVFCKQGWKTSRFVGFLLVVLVSGIAAGGLIEIIQGLSDYRSCDIKDFRADCIGLFSGALLTLAVWMGVRHRNGKDSRDGR